MLFRYGKPGVEFVVEQPNDSAIHKVFFIPNQVSFTKKWNCAACQKTEEADEIASRKNALRW